MGSRRPVFYREGERAKNVVISPRSHSQDAQCLPFSCQSNVPFISPGGPTRTVPSRLSRLHQLHPHWLMVPCPFQHIFYFSRYFFRFLKTFFKWLFRCLSLWRGGYHISFTVFVRFAFQNACLMLTNQCRVSTLAFEEDEILRFWKLWNTMNFYLDNEVFPLWF